MPDTYNWLFEIPFWEADPVGDESRAFSLEDFLVRSNRRRDAAWQAHFLHWCQGRTVEGYGARSIGPVHGIDMLLVTRRRVRRSLN
ncbi:MAG: hypothetical protein ACJ8GV_01410 [Luteimonas sp.]